MALHVWTESIDALRFLARRCRLQRSRAGRDDLITNVGSPRGMARLVRTQAHTHARGMQVQEWVSFGSSCLKQAKPARPALQRTRRETWHA